jgi:hypothetical protein
MCQIGRAVAREMRPDARIRVALQKGHDGRRCFGCPAAPGARAEVLLGRMVFGYPWSRIAEDFDVSRGGPLGFGMLVLAVAPWLASRWRDG